MMDWLALILSLELGGLTVLLLLPSALFIGRALAYRRFRGQSLLEALLAVAHTLGEFGVVLMVGGSIPGETKTVAIAIYDRVQAFDFAAAGYMSLLLLMFSVAVLALAGGWGRRFGKQPSALDGAQQWSAVALARDRRLARWPQPAADRRTGSLAAGGRGTHYRTSARHCRSLVFPDPAAPCRRTQFATRCAHRRSATRATTSYPAPLRGARPKLIQCRKPPGLLISTKSYDPAENSAGRRPYRSVQQSRRVP
jgi:hypothetical protein